MLGRRDTSLLRAFDTVIGCSIEMTGLLEVLWQDPEGSQPNERNASLTGYQLFCYARKGVTEEDCRRRQRGRTRASIR